MDVVEGAGDLTSWWEGGGERLRGGMWSCFGWEAVTTASSMLINPDWTKR